MRVHWLREALTDLADIEDYIAQDNPTAASALVDRVRDAAAQLANFPNLGRDGRVSGTYELVVAGTQYIVVYRIGQNPLEVIILTVRHAARRWPTHF